MEKSNTLWVGLSFLAVGLAVGLVVANGSDIFKANVLGSDSGQEQQQAFDVDSFIDSLEFVSVSDDDDAVIGSADAPVTIVEFSDYECPYCEKFESETYPLIKENYIDKGLVRLVFRDYPLPSHPEAGLAAEAAECAGEQGDELYFQMHEALFADTAAWTYQENAKEVMVDMAAELGVDISSCLDNGDMTDEVTADFTAGRGYGVSGTPSFFINGKKLVGAYPYEVFEAIIESELNN